MVKWTSGFKSHTSCTKLQPRYLYTSFYYYIQLRKGLGFVNPEIYHQCMYVCVCEVTNWLLYLIHGLISSGCFIVISSEKRSVRETEDLPSVSGPSGRKTRRRSELWSIKANLNCTEVFYFKFNYNWTRLAMVRLMMTALSLYLVLPQIDLIFWLFNLQATN